MQSKTGSRSGVLQWVVVLVVGRSDLVPVLETQRGNYENLVSTSKIDFVGPLVLGVGIVVIVYGLLMLLLARRLPPGTGRAVIPLANPAT